MGGRSKDTYTKTGTDTGAGIFSFWKSRQNSFSLPQPVMHKKTKLKTPKQKTAVARTVNSVVNTVARPQTRQTSAQRRSANKYGHMNRIRMY